MRIILISMVALAFLFACKTNKVNSQVVEKEKTEKEHEEVKPEKESDYLIDQTQKDLPDSLYTRLQRTACFGRCPIYTLSIFENGYVEYLGEKWVEKEGRFAAKLTAGQLKQIMEKANEIGFFKMDKQYDSAYVTDLPSTITTIRTEEGFKTVVNRYEGPESLSRLENFIDELVNGLEWEQIPQD